MYSDCDDTAMYHDLPDKNGEYEYTLDFLQKSTENQSNRGQVQTRTHQRDKGT